MHQGPLGGISMIVSLLIIAIGYSVRLVEHTGLRLGTLLERFLDSFINREHDTVVRRIFALTIPVNMFVLVALIMLTSAQQLYNDPARISVTELIPRAVSVAEGLVEQTAAKEATAATQLIAIETAPRVPADHARRPAYLFAHGATSTSLVDFLKANNLDSSIAFRKELATYFDEIPYRGSSEQDARILERMKALTASDLIEAQP